MQLDQLTSAMTDMTTNDDEMEVQYELFYNMKAFQLISLFPLPLLSLHGPSRLQHGSASAGHVELLIFLT